jgi:hypothetical protein
MKLNIKQIAKAQIQIISLIIIIASSLCTSCEDPCKVCQQAVYQLKFQGVADCQFSKCPGLVI